MEAMDYDVVILGCGPGGLQAAVHAARRKVRVLVLGRPGASSLARAHVENYLCVPGKAPGEELLRIGREQAAAFGADFREEDVVRMEGPTEAGGFRLDLEGGETVLATAVVVATGVQRRGLGLKGEKDLVGRGLSYCVDCDANFYRGRRVAVAGDGSAAAHGALTLSRIAAEVHLVTREPATSPKLLERLGEAGVRVLTGRGVAELVSDEQGLRGIRLDDGTELELDGLFVETGAKGAMELVSVLGVEMDPEKFTYIVTNKNQATNIPGIFACGDICGPPFQMAKAVGEGCVAGLAAADHVRKRRQEAGGGDP
ncbi:FAD-dependent oxidoreductase [Dissulfurirhabdus thermomarina]|uniref:FAD-dependent oxidoreductase n=2 Tax=Dissulfurirhabdus thermomarina TaxID=1765737 RepID=A0A6N9TPV6_DISTH|nr:FAD-dependent oxidoreductase [Dissulfurirhabdus thermomarina]NDY42133.1 FAD-dependent oxidoreductase [Dissulfurirhabdus thermomarina]NMX23143.1 FAD-dependent oxidoreductase [Dissulfurirhabdus thermomarina]